jgi:hypothetical protein
VVDGFREELNPSYVGIARLGRVGLAGADYRPAGHEGLLPDLAARLIA